MALPKGRLAENVLYFVRVLRAAGLPVGPAKVIDAISAVEAVGVANKTDFREALAAVLISRHEQMPLFEQAFDLFWRNPKLLEKMVASLLPRIYGRTGEEDAPPELPARLAQAMLPPKMPEARPDAEDEVDLDAALTFSAREILQKKDFATMTADELAQGKAMLARLKLPLPERPLRRTRPAAHGARIDLRATLRGMTGAAGAVAPLAWRARTRRAPPRKIGRRTNDDDLHWPRHPNGNHVGRHPVVRSDPGVEALRHDVDRRLAHCELKVDFRIRRQEASPDRRDHRRRSQMDRIDPQPPHGPLALLVQVLERAGDLADCRPQPLEQAQAGVGHRHAACRAVEQTYPETPLQLPHRVAERRRGDAEAGGRPSKAQLIGNGDERSQIRQVSTVHS